MSIENTQIPSQKLGTPFEPPSGIGYECGRSNCFASCSDLQKQGLLNETKIDTRFTHLPHPFSSKTRTTPSGHSRFADGLRGAIPRTHMRDEGNVAATPGSTPNRRQRKPGGHGAGGSPVGTRNQRGFEKSQYVSSCYCPRCFLFSTPIGTASTSGEEHADAGCEDIPKSGRFRNGYG